MSGHNSVTSGVQFQVEHSELSACLGIKKQQVSELLHRCKQHKLLTKQLKVSVHPSNKIKKHVFSVVIITLCTVWVFFAKVSAQGSRKF